MEEVTTNIKILMLGERSVGKSSLCMRFKYGDFKPEQLHGIGMVREDTTTIVNGMKVAFQIFDLVGVDQFRQIISCYSSGTQGLILVYDISDRRSFSRLDSWLSDVESCSTRDGMIKMLVGNKKDKEDRREVSVEEGLDFAREHSMLFTEASTLSRESTNSVFEQLAEKILQTPGLCEIGESKAGVSLTIGEQPVVGKARGYCVI